MRLRSRQRQPPTFSPPEARERLERLRAVVGRHRSPRRKCLLAVVDAMEAQFDFDSPDTLCLHHLAQAFASLCLSQKVGRLDGEVGRALAEFLGPFPPPKDMRGKPLPEPFPMAWI